MDTKTEKCPQCGGQAQGFAVMCGPRELGSEEMKCTTGIRACDFCGGFGIVEVAGAERYPKGEELRGIPGKKVGATQEQLARILRISGILGGEQGKALAR